MAKLGFISDEVVRIDLEEGTWVEIRKDMSFETMAKIQGRIKRAQDSDQADDVISATVDFLVESIMAWSDTLEVTPENVRRLNYSSIQALSELIVAHYTPEKKS